MRTQSKHPRRGSRSSSWRLLTAMLGVLALVLAACGSDDAREPAEEPDAVEEPAEEPDEEPEAAEPSVLDDYPDRCGTLDLIIPFGPGGGLDTQMRATVQDFEREIGISINILNIEGAGSQVGTVEMVEADPDGCTIGMVSLPSIQSVYVNPEREAGFDADDLEQIALHTADTHFVTVRADSEWETMQDLIDYMVENPGELVSSGQGILSPQHLSTVRFEQELDTQLRIVQFDGGAESTAGLLGGQADVTFDGFGHLSPHVESGDLRFLAVLSDTPHGDAPDVPPITDFGVNVVGEVSRGYVAPAGTPREIVEYLAEAIQRVTEDPGHQETIADIGLQIRYLGPDDFRAYWTPFEEAVGGALEGLD